MGGEQANTTGALNNGNQIESSMHLASRMGNLMLH